MPLSSAFGRTVQVQRIDSPAPETSHRIDAVVSGLVWLDADQLGRQQVESLRSALTIVPSKPDYGGEVEVDVVQCWSAMTSPPPGGGEPKNWFGVPRAYFASMASSPDFRSYQTKVLLCDGEPMSDEARQGAWAASGNPCFDEQAQAVQVVADHFGKFDGTAAGLQYLGGIVKAATGFGKTVVALRVLAELGRAAVVVVHKEFLMRQWEERIRHFLPKASVGIVRADTCRWRGCDIVIAMAQSLAQEQGPETGQWRYPREMYRHFGALVVDEVHRIGAPTWAPIPRLFPAKFRLGLSATPRRRDGADSVFSWHIGRVVYAAKNQTPVPAVRRRVIAHKQLPRVLTSRDAPRGVALKVLSENRARNALIVHEVVAAVTSANKRKVLVLSDRLKHLESLKQSIELALRAAGSDATVDCYVGRWFDEDAEVAGAKRKLDEAELKQAMRAQVILATYQMCSEGVDIQAADTLVLASPVSDVEQAVGRIRRVCIPDRLPGGNVPKHVCEFYCPWRSESCQGKPQPVVVDIVDQGAPLFERSAKHRERYYDELEAKQSTVTISAETLGNR